MELSLVGLQSAGKTSLVNAITTGGHSEDRIPTIGFNMRNVTAGNETVKLWDLVGKRMFRSMRERYCRGSLRYSFKGATSLQQLTFETWSELTCLPEGLLQPTLVDITIRSCRKLRMLNPTDETEAAFNGSTSLQRLEIVGCNELTCLPKGLLQPTLARLCLIGCPELKAPNPDELRSLTSLKNLWIISCPNWGSCWEDGLFCTTSLQSLNIGEFGEEYGNFPWPSTSAASPPSSHFTSLRELGLWGWPEVKSLPDQLEHLPALCDLTIWNPRGLESLPEWLRNLSSLQHLSISGCPLFEKRCEKGIGEDWHKIAHIPYLQIGDVYINDEE